MRPGVRLAESSTYMYTTAKSKKIKLNLGTLSILETPLAYLFTSSTFFDMDMRDLLLSSYHQNCPPRPQKAEDLSSSLSLFSLFGIDAYRPYLGLRTTVYGLRSLCHPVLSLLSTPPALLLPYPSLFTVAQPVLYAAVTLWVLWVHSGQFYRESIQIQVGQPHSDGARMGSTNKQGRGPVLHCGAFPVRDSD